MLSSHWVCGECVITYRAALGTWQRVLIEDQAAAAGNQEVIRRERVATADYTTTEAVRSFRSRMAVSPKCDGECMTRMHLPSKSSRAMHTVKRSWRTTCAHSMRGVWHTLCWPSPFALLSLPPSFTEAAFA